MSQPDDEFVNLARIVADLVHDPARAAFEFFLQFEELRDDFVFAEFEVGDDAAGVELGGAETGIVLRAGAGDIHAAIHLGE